MKPPVPGERFAFTDPSQNAATVVLITQDGCEFALPDGAGMVARPQPDDAYRIRARELGYNSPIGMCREHDLLHAKLAHALGLPESPALRAAVSGQEPSELTNAEEAMVLAAATFLNIARRTLP